MAFWDTGLADGGWGVVMMLGMLGIWVSVVAVLVLAVMWAVRAPTADSTPEQVLAERLARGEIDADEYRRRINVLIAAGGGGGAPRRRT